MIIHAIFGWLDVLMELVGIGAAASFSTIDSYPLNMADCIVTFLVLTSVLYFIGRFVAAFGFGFV